jgi:hypothetical protein
MVIPMNENNPKGQLISSLLEMMMDTNKESMTISTPAKGGELKIYCDFSDLEACKKRINNAFEARKYANNMLSMEKVI